MGDIVNAIIGSSLKGLGGSGTTGGGTKLPPLGSVPAPKSPMVPGASPSEGGSSPFLTSALSMLKGGSGPQTVTPQMKVQ